MTIIFPSRSVLLAALLATGCGSTLPSLAGTWSGSTTCSGFSIPLTVTVTAEGGLMIQTTEVPQGELITRLQAIASERTSHGALAARAGYLARQPCPCIGRHLGQRIGSRIDTGGQVDPWQGRIGKCPRHRIDPPTMAQSWRLRPISPSSQSPLAT